MRMRKTEFFCNTTLTIIRINLNPVLAFALINLFANKYAQHSNNNLSG